VENVIHLIEENRQALERLCVRYHVARLELFGSAATGLFDHQTSDLDFLVEFLPLGPGRYADAYFALLESLETLFGRPVDLVVARAIRNRYLLQSIDETRTVLYAA
jgi:predicted nucleotidyltransferase